MACFIPALFRTPKFFPPISTTRSVRSSRALMMTSATVKKASRNELIFLGTGVSTGLPQISCTLPRAGGACEVCMEALRDPTSPNRRCNVSALIRVAGRCVMIDCGKTFRETALRHFHKFGVDGVDAIVITHAHADAYLGLDDVRDIQKYDAPPMPVYLSEDTFEACERVYPYLMPKPVESDVERRVAAINWSVVSRTFHKFHPVPDIEDLSFTAIPLYHGGTYICWGFLIETPCEHNHSERNIIAYLSDVKEIPSESWDFLYNCGHINLLVVDCLGRKPHPTHFCLDEAIDVARKLQPDITKCVGMGHSLPHRAVNEELSTLKKTEGLDIQLAHDGLCLSLS